MLKYAGELPQDDPEQTLAGDDPALQQELSKSQSRLYLQGLWLGFQSCYLHFPTEDLKGGLNEINGRVYSIFDSEIHAFKLNLALGYIYI